MKFSIKYFFSKCDEIPSFLQIWSHLLKKSLTENFIFCAVIGWVPSFFLLEIVTLLVLLHLGLEVVTEADTDPKEKFLSSKVTLSLSLMTEFSAFMPLQGIAPGNKGIAPGNSWLGGVSTKDYTTRWKIKIREMKTR